MKTNELSKKKTWKKAEVITIKKNDLAEYIKAAARSTSGGCYGFGR